MIVASTETYWPDIIAAIGAVFSSLLAVYLVHRRVVADKETVHWRNGQQLHQQQLVDELRSQVSSLKDELLMKAEKTKGATDDP